MGTKSSPVILPNKDKIDTTECEVLVERVVVLAIYSTVYLIITINNIDVPVGLILDTLP